MEIILGIDLSNIRAGGGVTHIKKLLEHARPLDEGFSKIVVWGGDDTLVQLKDQPWLEKKSHPLLNGGGKARFKWRRSQLLKEIATCDIMFYPGGTYLGKLHPFVAMCQNMLVFEKQERDRFKYKLPYFRYLLLHRFQKKTFKGADGLIYLTEYARDYVSRYVQKEKEKTAVIAHGLSKEFFQAPRPTKSIAEFSPQNPFKILYVSIINLYKHQWVLAEAVFELLKEGIPLELHLVGANFPPAMSRLENTLEKYPELRDRIKVHGLVNHNDLPNFYKNCDLFAFSSSCENLPIIMLEAMSAGIPIMSSDRGPMPEVLKDGGLFYDPERVDDTKKVLLKMIEDHHLRSQLAQKSFEIAQEYSWERCAEKTFKFIRTTYDTPKS